MNQLFNVGIRQQALFIPTEWRVADVAHKLKGTTTTLVANLRKLGFGVSEELLHALNQLTPPKQLDILNKFAEVTGVNKNWTPLVKGWDVPTNESVIDHIMVFFANIFGAKGTKLQCGHIIPADTFPLERYNGCPFCGTPFEFGKIEVTGQSSKLKTLELWTEKEAEEFLVDLLASKTALDATQMDSLKILLQNIALPKDVNVGMKETLMAIIDLLIEQGKNKEAQRLFSSPVDILRYLWFKRTGFLQIVEPKTILKRKNANNKNIHKPSDKSGKSGKEYLTAKNEIKLHYSRTMCGVVATWLNGLKMDTEKICEAMHPKRGMWVRFIRALRLPEYSKKAGFEKLKQILDTFYNENYTVWQGRVDYYRLKADEDQTYNFLKQRPGLFARSLFANMLWFGAENAVNAFAEVIDKVPARLVFTLNMYAKEYFTLGNRIVKPLGGISKTIPKNELLKLYDAKQLVAMQTMIEELCVLAMKKRFANQETTSKTMFIDPALFYIPVSIGDRGENVQDLPSALMGTRFPVEGGVVRLFMQWGNGLPAQHLDMDLSCAIQYPNTTQYCSYSNLSPTGCQHSGDIRSIPEKVGTAEYIEIDVNALAKSGAKYVSFTCNAYSNGAITPNMVIGWMNSKFPMKISEKTGVAYDPSCVQHQVRITQTLTKGMMFGVLDIEAREVVWLEMPFGGQVVQNMNLASVQAILAKLSSKLTIGNLLKLKAEAQNITIVEELPADLKENPIDEIYDFKWASNPAKVTKLLVD
jgi:hypothetical protein